MESLADGIQRQRLRLRLSGRTGAVERLRGEGDGVAAVLLGTAAHQYLERGTRAFDLHFTGDVPILWEVG
ncbi:MAG TPA: hypothetical protein VKU02_15645, partial [Gemmataceae bacterium]|nr:hypothetical protein [Gemmataceae bacterium]